ncbi:hypothetical protein ACJJTC_001587 [Scirpophaga incertulas]
MPKPTPTPPNASRRNPENPAEELNDRETTTNPAALICLSRDRTSSTVRDYGEEGGGESPAPHLCGPSGVIQILENVQIAPPSDSYSRTPIQPKPETTNVPRVIKMPSESPASPEDDEEFRTPTRTPTREVGAAPETARPAGSARESASRDASRDRATARAAAASAPRGRAAAVDVAPRGAVARAPLGSAAAASAPRGRAGAVTATRVSTGKPAPRGSDRGAGPSGLTGSTTKKPQTPPQPHLAASGRTTTPIGNQKTVAPKTTPTPPNVPHNTPSTPATTVPIKLERGQPISRSATDMLPPKSKPRSSSRQSDRSAKSNRSADSTPERSGSRHSLEPPLSEPRALVSTPTPGFSPSAPAPFTRYAAIETPRAASKRAREEGEGDSDKAKPAVRPKTGPSPASQTQIPSTSYADQLRTACTAEDTQTPAMKPKKRRGGKGRGKKAARQASDDTEQTQKPQATTTATKTTTSTPAAARPENATLPPKPKREGTARRVKIASSDICTSEATTSAGEPADGVLCRACYTLLSQCTPDSSPRRFGHLHVCIGCDTSRSHRLATNAPILQYFPWTRIPQRDPNNQLLVNEGPNVIHELIQDIPMPPPQPPVNPVSASVPRDPVVGSIVMFNYKRAANTSRYCIFRNCNGLPWFIIPTFIKKYMIKENNIYILRSARVCRDHLYGNDWDTLPEVTTLVTSFDARQLEDLINILKSEKSMFDFERVEEMPNHICHYWTGLEVAEFLILFRESPSNLEDAPEQRKIVLFLNAAGEEAVEVYNTFNKKFERLEDVVTELKSYSPPKWLPVGGLVRHTMLCLRSSS